MAMVVATESDQEEQASTVTINCYNHPSAVVTKEACKILLKQHPNISILILGEGENHSYCTALAALRKGWNNIYVSHWIYGTHASHSGKLTNFQEALKHNRIMMKENLSRLDGFEKSEEKLKKIKKQLNLLNEPSIIETAENNEWNAALEASINQMRETGDGDQVKNICKILVDYKKEKNKSVQQINNLLEGSKAANKKEIVLNKVVEILEEFAHNKAKEKKAAANDFIEIGGNDEAKEKKTAANDFIDIGSNDEGWLRQPIDAENLQMFKLKGKKFFPEVIIFQCPYVKEDTGDYRHTGSLVRNLFLSASHLQKPPKYIFIGIHNFFPYANNYELTKLLGKPHESTFAHYAKDSVCYECGYEFIGVDLQFTKEILKFGYEHEGDILYKMINNHAMLCFRRKIKKSSSDTEPQFKERNLGQ